MTIGGRTLVSATAIQRGDTVRERRRNCCLVSRRHRDLRHHRIRHHSADARNRNPYGAWGTKRVDSTAGTLPHHDLRRRWRFRRHDRRRGVVAGHSGRSLSGIEAPVRRQRHRSDCLYCGRSIPSSCRGACGIVPIENSVWSFGLWNQYLGAGCLNVKRLLNRERMEFLRTTAALRGNHPFVLRVRADPGPENAARDLLAQSSVCKADSYRPVFSCLLEVKRWMTRIGLQQFEIGPCQLLNLDWQPIEKPPEVWTREMLQSSRLLPAL